MTRSQQSHFKFDLKLRIIEFYAEDSTLENCFALLDRKWIFFDVKSPYHTINNLKCAHCNSVGRKASEKSLKRLIDQPNFIFFLPHFREKSREYDFA